MSTGAIGISVNGEARRVPTGTTLAQLVGELAGGGRGVAVAVDREVVPRSQWADAVIEDGTSIEVVTAVAGG